MKKFDDEDVFVTTTKITEQVRILRKFFSGTNSTYSNIQNPISYNSGSQSGSLYSIIWDKPFNDEAANKLCSITFGYTTNSENYSEGNYQKEKNKIYKLFAKKLLGNNKSIFFWNNKQQHELIFISIYRNLYKDQINDLNLTGHISGAFNTTPIDEITIFNSDKNFDFYGGPASYLVSGSTEVGLLFKKAGIIVIDPNFVGTSSAGGNFWSASVSYSNLIKLKSPDDVIFGIRYRIGSLVFNNNSFAPTTFFKCSAELEEFNYSSNKTFIDDQGQIITNSGSIESLTPTTYITTVALLGKNNEVISVAKIPKPIKKDNRTKVVIHVRSIY